MVLHIVKSIVGIHKVCTLLYFTLLYFTLLHFTSLHFTSLHFTSLHFTLLYFTLLYFTLLYFTLSSSACKESIGIPMRKPLFYWVVTRSHCQHLGMHRAVQRSMIVDNWMILEMAVQSTLQQQQFKCIHRGCFNDFLWEAFPC